MLLREPCIGASNERVALAANYYDNLCSRTGDITHVKLWAVRPLSRGKPRFSI